MTSTPTDLEKQAALKFAGDTTSPSPNRTQRPSHPPRHYGHEAKEKIRHFLHPDGHRVHVANSPEEATKLRTKLQRLHQDSEFDVYVSGTPEHIEAVRRARQHHETRRSELEAEHKDVYERFSDIHAELDMLSSELERVTTHGVSLEAHFSKYGYDAHIRSYDDEESPSHSGTSTPRGSISGSTLHSDSGQSLKLWKMPVVRQYFHNGILWRASRNEEVQSFELFVDLLYVGIIAINGDAASEHPTGQSLQNFAITFTLSWKIWNDMAQIISWFETDDIAQRISIVFLLSCLFGYTTNIHSSFSGETYPTLLGFYLCSRLFNATYLCHIAFVLPMVRPVMIYHVVITLIGAALWIGSIHVAYPYQLILIWIALVWDVFSAAFIVILKIIAHSLEGSGKGWFERTFEFWPAINIEHRTERQNAFVTLVFGYTVVAMLYQSTVNGIDAFFGKAVLGLIQAFCFNWIYFEIDGANLQYHAIRRHKISALGWSMVHLPFIMAFVLGGGALSRLVLVTDTHGSAAEHVTETYQARSEHEVLPGHRWFYCAGFGVALACMGLISISHVHKEIEGLRLKKRYRLAWRFCIAIILICLPLAESLDSLQLIGTVTALIVFALGTELWASSCASEGFCGRSKPCKYSGMCGKSKLQAMVRDGKEVDITQLAASSRTGSTDAMIVGP